MKNCDIPESTEFDTQSDANHSPLFLVRPLLQRISRLNHEYSLHEIIEMGVNCNLFSHNKHIQ